MDRPALALIGHLETPTAYLELLGDARGDDLPPLTLDDIAPLLRVMDPLPICSVIFRSIRGVAVHSCYVDVALPTPAHIGLGKAVARIQLACKEAARAGARLGVLGGFTKIAGERTDSDPAHDPSLTCTTGNTLTAAVIAEQIASLEPNLGTTVTVVGAGGDIGSGLSRILCARGADLLLVGRTPAPLARVAAELKRARVLAWPDAAADSRIIVLVASVPEGSIPLDIVPAQALVLDAGHPPNGRSDGNGRYAVAGRVTHAVQPECDLPALLSKRYEAGETHACFAEGVVLAFEERWEPFSKGKGMISPTRAAEIVRLAERHGIRPAPLRFTSHSDASP